MWLDLGIYGNAIMKIDTKTNMGMKGTIKERLAGGFKSINARHNIR